MTTGRSRSVLARDGRAGHRTHSRRAGHAARPSDQCAAPVDSRQGAREGRAGIRPRRPRGRRVDHSVRRRVVASRCGGRPAPGADPVHRRLGPRPTSPEDAEARPPGDAGAGDHTDTHVWGTYVWGTYVWGTYVWGTDRPNSGVIG